MDRHLCHPRASTRQLHADGVTAQAVAIWSDNSQSRWMRRASTTTDATSQQFVGPAWYFTRPCYTLQAVECCAPSYISCDDSTAMRWHHLSGNTIKSQHAKRRAGSWRSNLWGSINFVTLKYLSCWCLLKKVVAMEKIWFKQIIKGNNFISIPNAWLSL